MANINPTRMNLINLKRRIAVARKGHGILKRKQEVLIIEFLRLLKSSKESRSALNRLITQSYRVLTIASTYVGNFELEDVALHMREAGPIAISIKNIMGVRIPEIKKPLGQHTVQLSLLSSSLAVDDINDSFARAADSIIEVAQMEQGLKRLVTEIDKTKRRVNALDYRVIPQMASQSKYIRMRLEEMERDTFSALKHVKRKMARRSQEGSAQSG